METLNKEQHQEKHSEHHAEHKKNDEITITTDTIVTLLIAVVTLLILFNQWQIYSLSTGTAGGFRGPPTGGVAGAASLAGLDAYTTIGPMLLADGEQPAISGYKTKFKSIPTISAHEIPASTGDAVQDAINALIPTGTPEYGVAAGVSFDDPVKSLAKLGSYDKSIQLTGADLERYNRIVGSFTCDYCCGSPKSPTIINRCGCAHAAAWRGLARLAIKNYGDKVTDLQIVGEMTRWKNLFYPGPTVKRVFEEQSTGGSGGAATSLSNLPSMVGGC